MEDIELVPENLWKQNADERHTANSESQNSIQTDLDHDSNQMGCLANDLLVESLQQFIRADSRSSGNSFQFLDLMLKSLTSSMPRHFTNSIKDYLRKVK